MKPSYIDEYLFHYSVWVEDSLDENYTPKKHFLVHKEPIENVERVIPAERIPLEELADKIYGFLNSEKPKQFSIPLEKIPLTNLSKKNRGIKLILDFEYIDKKIFLIRATDIDEFSVKTTRFEGKHEIKPKS